MIKKIIKIVSFLLILTMLGGTFVKNFRFKYGDGIYPLTVFYEQEKDSIDAMCFGSSNIFENVNTGVLWDSYGIASFNLCGSIQPLWNTYYYMKEALKTQTPKVMVVDVYGAIQTEDYIDESRIIKNNYGLKFSKDKIESIKASAPEDQWLNYFLEYPTFHSRYSELTREDFKEYLGKENWKSWKGIGINTNTMPQSAPEGIETASIGHITDKVETYLMKIIQLSKDRKVPLLLIKTPYQISVKEQEVYNQVAQIAKDNGIPFLNFNDRYDEIGLDFKTDYADTVHMNHRGNIKFTNYLGAYLNSNYEIPDRRGDKGYTSYDIQADDCRQRLYNQELLESVDLNTYLDKVENENYLAVFSARGNYKNGPDYEKIKMKLCDLGINLDEVEGESVWVKDRTGVLYTSGNETNYEWHMELNSDNNVMVIREGKEQQPVVNLSNTEYTASLAGINVLVYDKFTGMLVDSAGFPSSNGYQVMR